MSNYYKLSRYIANIYRLSKNDFNRQIALLDVRATQSDLLMFLSDHAPIDQKAIATAMAVAPGLVTRDLKVLLAKGLIISVADATDHRKHIIKLSSLGDKLVLKLRSLMNEWWENQLATLPNGSFIDQLEALANQLRIAKEDK